MELCYGVFVLCISVIFWFILFVNVRNPNGPQWASSAIIDQWVLPCLIVAAAAGICSVISFFLSAANGAIDYKGLILSAAMVALSVLLLLVMRIPQKLKQFNQSIQSSPASFRIGPTVGS
jgi:hypothetical protein